jgi:hypothetical protein
MTCRFGYRSADAMGEGRFLKAEDLNSKRPDLYSGVCDIGERNFQVSHRLHILWTSSSTPNLVPNPTVLRSFFMYLQLRNAHVHFANYAY